MKQRKLLTRTLMCSSYSDCSRAAFSSMFFTSSPEELGSEPSGVVTTTTSSTWTFTSEDEAMGATCTAVCCFSVLPGVRSKKIIIWRIQDLVIKQKAGQAGGKTDTQALLIKTIKRLWIKIFYDGWSTVNVKCSSKISNKDTDTDIVVRSNSRRNIRYSHIIQTKQIMYIFYVHNTEVVHMCPVCQNIKRKKKNYPAIHYVLACCTNNEGCFSFHGTKSVFLVLWMICIYPSTDIRVQQMGTVQII